MNFSNYLHLSLQNIYFLSKQVSSIILISNVTFQICIYRSVIIITKWLQLVNTFGVSLLWSGIFLAAGCYVLHVSLMVSCRPVQSGNIYKEYVDNKDVSFLIMYIAVAFRSWTHVQIIIIYLILSQCRNTLIEIFF